MKKAITISLVGSGDVIELRFINADQPQTISIMRWNAEYATGSQDISDVIGDGEPVFINWNTLSISIADNGHDYIYEVFATWHEGSSYYTFRTLSGDPA